MYQICKTIENLVQALIRLYVYMYRCVYMYMYLFTQRLDLQSIALIGKEEGIKGYWKGNLPQVCSSCPFIFPLPETWKKKNVYFVKYFS